MIFKAGEFDEGKNAIPIFEIDGKDIKVCAYAPTKKDADEFLKGKVNEEKDKKKRIARSEEIKNKVLSSAFKKVKK